MSQDLNYLSDALDQLRSDLQERLKYVQNVELGMPLDALQDATYNRCRVFIAVVSGYTRRRGIGDCDEGYHNAMIRFYFSLTSGNRDLVEKAIADMVLQLPSQFNASSVRQLVTSSTDGSVIADWDLRSDAQTGLSYDVGYEQIGGKWHRVLLYPIEIHVVGS